MILSDREIQAAIRRNLIVLDPCPPSDSPRWSATTVDLTLDAEIRPWTQIDSDEEERTITPGRPGFNSNDLINRVTTPQDCTDSFTIGPHQLILGWTCERLKLPHESRIGARVEGKSSLARLGIGVHITAPTIHPGFGVNRSNAAYIGSSIRLEIWNCGPLRIKLKKGMPICQLLFEEVHGTPMQGYSGQYNVQGPGSQSSK